jgi:hypothetical protein
VFDLVRDQFDVVAEWKYIDDGDEAPCRASLDPRHRANIRSPRFGRNIELYREARLTLDPHALAPERRRLADHGFDRGAMKRRNEQVGRQLELSRNNVGSDVLAH